MPSTIGPMAAAPHAAVATVSNAQSAGASRSQQLAALSEMLNKYQTGISHGESVAILAPLGKQITAAAKALGQHVTLPQAPATPATVAPPPSAAAGPAAAHPRSAVNTTA